MASKNKENLKRSLIIMAAAVLALFVVVKVNAASSTINVNVTIPNVTPPPPPIDNAPTISNVSVTSTESTATISWGASDDHGVSSASISYGLTASYGLSGTVTGSYTSTLGGLSPGTQYFYEIAVSDNGGHTTLSSGSFWTVAHDSTAPNISGLTVTPDVYGASFVWNTSEPSDSQLNYGSTVAYGLGVSDPAFSLNHSFTVNGLLANATYHYRIIATDNSGNATTTGDGTFTTLPDAVPPADVSNLTLTATTNTISLAWSNPADADFLNIRVVRKAGSAPTSPSDGTLLFNGVTTTLVDAAAAPQTVYYYAVYSYDTSGNRSGGALVFGQLQPLPPPPVEICNNNIDDNSNGLTDCADPACTNAQVCQPPQPEICNNSIDDNSNGFVDCADPACINSPVCAPAAVEICGNGIDDDGNTLIDCSDPACRLTVACTIPGGTAPIETCNNGADDNNNGFTDCADTACFGYPSCIFTPPTSTPSSTDEHPTVTVPVFERIDFSAVSFFTANRQVEIAPRDGVITSLAGVNFTVAINAARLPVILRSGFVSVDGEKHMLAPDENGRIFYADFVFPQVGDHRAMIQVDYGNDQSDGLEFSLRSLALGQVISDKKPVSEVVVSLYSVDGDKLLNTTRYGLGNPQTTYVNGTFGWTVPNGKYYIIASKDRFYTRKTPPFQVDNNVVNQTINLIQLPPKLDLNPQNLKKIAGIATQVSIEKISDTLVGVKEFVDDPVVQDTVTTVVAPTVVGVVAVSTVTVVSWANILPFLQLIFFQPLVFLGGRRKREAWGQVYNSLNKLPVDLATVRLLNSENNRIVQSKVTDSQGRYAFVANPGTYRIEVMKHNFTFPSALLKDSKNDGKKLDIYHGETITVSEDDAIITANIPLDPVGEHEKPARLFWQRTARRLQIGISWFGLALTILAIYISPRWYMWLLLGIHLLFFVILHVLAAPPKIKSWGIVYDINSKQPVGRTVARLFNVQFNKLVASQVTDSKGRYYFLAGDNEYYITYEHPSYDIERTDIIDLKGKSAEAINVDVGLHGKGDDSTHIPAVFEKLSEVPKPTSEKSENR